MVYRPLEVAVGDWKKDHIYALCIKKKEKKTKIEQCDNLLLVLGGGLALIRSYSERWQRGCVDVVQCAARLEFKSGH